MIKCCDVTAEVSKGKVTINTTLSWDVQLVAKSSPEGEFPEVQVQEPDLSTPPQ